MILVGGSQISAISTEDGSSLIGTSEAQRTFEESIHEKKIVIPANAYESVDLPFDSGELQEVIFNFNVKDNLPIDFWFVNKDNYLLLTGGAQFLFFVDASGQQISYAKRIVTLTEHNNYKLVLTNYYANKSVEVDLTYELRSYENPIEKRSLFDLPLFDYTLIIAVIVLAIVFVISFMKLRNARTFDHESGTERGPHGKRRGDKSRWGRNKKKQGNSNKNNRKKSNPKNNQKASKVNNKNQSKETKKTKVKKSEKISTKDSKTGSQNFCGFCGTVVNTPFCKGCGEKV